MRNYFLWYQVTCSLAEHGSAGPWFSAANEMTCHISSHWFQLSARDFGKPFLNGLPLEPSSSCSSETFTWGHCPEAADSRALLNILWAALRSLEVTVWTNIPPESAGSRPHGYILPLATFSYISNKSHRGTCFWSTNFLQKLYNCYMFLW